MGLSPAAVLELRVAAASLTWEQGLWGAGAVLGLRIAAASLAGEQTLWGRRGSSWAAVQWLLLLGSRRSGGAGAVLGLRVAAASLAGEQMLWARGFRHLQLAATVDLWCTGLVASRHVGSSWIRN